MREIMTSFGKPTSKMGNLLSLTRIEFGEKSFYILACSGAIGNNANGKTASFQSFVQRSNRFPIESLAVFPPDTHKSSTTYPIEDFHGKVLIGRSRSEYFGLNSQSTETLKTSIIQASKRISLDEIADGICGGILSLAMLLQNCKTKDKKFEILRKYHIESDEIFDVDEFLIYMNNWKTNSEIHRSSRSSWIELFTHYCSSDPYIKLREVDKARNIIDAHLLRLITSTNERLVMILWLIKAMLSKCAPFPAHMRLFSQCVSELQRCSYPFGNRTYHFEEDVVRFRNVFGLRSMMRSGVQMLGHCAEDVIIDCLRCFIFNTDIDVYTCFRLFDKDKSVDQFEYIPNCFRCEVWFQNSIEELRL